MSLETLPTPEQSSRKSHDQPASLESLSHDAFMSLGSMEGIYAPIVEAPSYWDSLSAQAYASLGSMEGLHAPAVPEPAPHVAPGMPEAAERRWPGFLAAALVACVAYLIHYLPFAPFRVADAGGVRYPIGAAILAIVVGVVARNTLPLPDAIRAGCKRIVKRIIPIAIVLTGAGLNLSMLASIGPPALLVTILSMVLAIGCAYYVGRWLGIGQHVAMLIGAGTGICGNSAIVAVAPLIDAEDDDLVLSIGTINLFGLVVMLACPMLGPVLGLSAEQFGVWAGTTIHAVPQVVAAGFAFSPEAAELATLVKLVRVTLLAPLVFVLAMFYARHHKADAGSGVIVHYARFVPWFVWGFVCVALLGTVNLIPRLLFPAVGWLDWPPREVDTIRLATTAGKLLLTLAMAAIGLEVNIRMLARVSARAVLTGLIASAALCAASYLLICLFL